MPPTEPAVRLTVTEIELAAPVAATAATDPGPVFDPRTMFDEVPCETPTDPVFTDTWPTPRVVLLGAETVPAPKVFIVTLALLAAPVADTAIVAPTPLLDTVLLAILVIEPLFVTAAEFVADCVAPVLEMSIVSAAAALTPP
jgi:hypothetical protein